MSRVSLLVSPFGVCCKVFVYLEEVEVEEVVRFTPAGLRGSPHSRIRHFLTDGEALRVHRTALFSALTLECNESLGVFWGGFTFLVCPVLGPTVFGVRDRDWGQFVLTPLLPRIVFEHHSFLNNAK